RHRVLTTRAGRTGSVPVMMQPPLAAVDVGDSLDQVFADLSGPNAAVVVAAAGRPAAILTRSDRLEYLAHQRPQVNGPPYPPRSRSERGDGIEPGESRLEP